MIFLQYLDLYYVDLKYIRDLAKTDSNVMSNSPQIGKNSRPYLGIILMVNNKQYCIPLTSTQNKQKNGKKIKNNIDYIKIPHPTRKDENGASVILGALNINNMIPVNSNVIKKYDLSDKPNDQIKEKQRKIICRKERAWCQIASNTELIIKRANAVYDIVVNNPEKNPRLVRRCCNFKKLEEVLAKYTLKSNENNPDNYYYILIENEEQLEKLRNSNIPFKINKDKTVIIVDISDRERAKKCISEIQSKKNQHNPKL